jgi:hypothetical protein
MTETARILDLLAKRAEASKCYGTSEASDAGSLSGITLHVREADVLVYMEADKSGRAKVALSFAAPHGSTRSVHLNQWARPEGEMSDSDLVTDLWRSFWEFEVANLELGRLQWMHGPHLPLIKEEKIPEAKPNLVNLSEQDFLDLFE